MVSSAWAKAVDGLLDKVDTYPGMSSDWADEGSSLGEAQVRALLCRKTGMPCAFGIGVSLPVDRGTYRQRTCNESMMCAYIHTHEQVRVKRVCSLSIS